MKKVFNFQREEVTVQFNDLGLEPVEIMFYSSIGEDPWDGKGMTAADLETVLRDIPRNRQLLMLVNSPGGDVHQGLAMKNRLEEWPNKITARVMGIAASTMSWMILAADEIEAFKNSQVFIHDAMGICIGNASEMEKMMDNLDKVSNQIAEMYSDKTGKSTKEMRNMMRDETLLTGEEAEDLGLVDKVIDGKAVRNFAPKEIAAMSNKLKAYYNSANRGGQPKTQVMNKKKIIAILNKAGIKEWDGKPISEETSEEVLMTALESLELRNQQPPAPAPAPAPTPAPAPSSTVSRADLQHPQVIIDLQNEVRGLRELNNQARRNRYDTALNTAVSEDRLPANLRDKALKRALAMPEPDGDEYINELVSLPSRPPGADPLRAGPSIECTSEAFGDIQNFILDNGPRFTNRFIGNRTDRLELDERTRKDMAARAIVVYNMIKKHKPQLIAMFNANVIDANLQRIMILQEMIEEFAVILLPLTAFSTVFSNVPLEGTDQVAVPFFPLDANASTSWDPNNGYVSTGTQEDVRLVAIGGSGVNSGNNAAANTAKDRKYQAMTFSSYEMRRQPYLNLVKLFVQKANKLGVDVFKDIISRVLTAGNYGASIKAIAANAFAGDDVADLYGTATARNWPQGGRSLVLDHTYNVSLLKDPTFKQYLAYGSTDPLRKAAIQEAYGFENIHVVPNLTSYSPAGEFLTGFICYMYGMLVASAPIMPTPAVRALLVQYDLVVHPSIGVAFEYRQWGAPQLDQTQEAVEFSYGAAKGVATGIGRITSQ